MKRPYLLSDHYGNVWYYRLAGEKTFHSTGVQGTRNPRTGKLSHRPEAETFARDQSVRVKPGETTLQQFVDAQHFFLWSRCLWIRKQHALGKSFGKLNARNRRGHLDNHILPALGDTPLHRLTKKLIEDWLASLDLSNQSRNHILYTLRIVLREARDARLVAENPLQEPNTFGRQYVPRDVFSVAELRHLFPADAKELRRIWFSDDMATMFLVLASTGIRSGEVRALRWKHVLWEERALLIEECVKGDGEGSVEFGTISELKGGARIVLLPSRTLEALRRWQSMATYIEPEDLLFPGSTREMPVICSTSRKLFSAIARVNAKAVKAGLPKLIDTTGRNLVAHSLRHTYNTIMRRQIPEEVLQSLTGHSSAAMTDRYDHPKIAEKISALEPARKAIEGIL